MTPAEGQAENAAHDSGPGLAPESWPRLVIGAALRADPRRGGDVLLLPERIVRLSESATRIVRLCDGTRQVSTVIEELVAEYGAPEQIEREVNAFLLEVTRRGWVELHEAGL